MLCLWGVFFLWGLFCCGVFVKIVLVDFIVVIFLLRLGVCVWLWAGRYVVCFDVRDGCL